MRASSVVNRQLALVCFLLRTVKPPRAWRTSLPVVAAVPTARRVEHGPTHRTGYAHLGHSDSARARTVAPGHSDRAAHLLRDVPQQPATTGAGAAAALQLHSDAARSALPCRAGVPHQAGKVAAFDVGGDRADIARSRSRTRAPSPVGPRDCGGSVLISPPPEVGTWARRVEPVEGVPNHVLLPQRGEVDRLIGPHAVGHQ